VQSKIACVTSAGSVRGAKAIGRWGFLTGDVCNKWELRILFCVGSPKDEFPEH